MLWTFIHFLQLSLSSIATRYDMIPNDDVVEHAHCHQLLLHIHSILPKSMSDIQRPVSSRVCYQIFTQFGHSSTAQEALTLS